MTKQLADEYVKAAEAIGAVIKEPKPGRVEDVEPEPEPERRK